MAPIAPVLPPPPPRAPTPLPPSAADGVTAIALYELPDIRDSDDPAEEKIRLMQDVKRLDEDALDGLTAVYHP